jgi:dihydroorotase
VSRLLIRNGRLIDPSQDLDQGMDVLIDDGCVSRVGERLDPPADSEIVDVAGLVVAPGFIDLHTHLREPGFEYKETIESGCRAAVAGGFTAVCCMANTDPVNDDPAVTRFIRERASDVAPARVYPIGAVSKGLLGAELAEVGEMVREGAVAISDDCRPITDALLMRRALEYAQSFDIPVAVHAEDPDLSDGGVMHEGAVSTRIGLKGLPAASEEVMVARDILLAERTGGRIHLCHLSTGWGVDLLRSAKQRGVSVTGEVAAHHFTLTDEDVAAANYDPNWKTNPPLRTAGDVEAVREALADGTVDAIVSNHAPHHADEKELDFSQAPFGIVGLETTVSLAIDRLVHGKVLPFDRLVRLFSTGPAEIFNLPGGTLRVGAPADVTILDPRRQVTIDPQGFESKARNTPFAGMRLRGGPVMTIVGGNVVWRAKRQSQ